MVNAGFWEPNEWEAWVNSLLSVRYGSGYQRVPAGDRGDFGIEGFDQEGRVYQCYAPQGSGQMKDRKERIKSKIYSDTEKLKTNDPHLSTLLAPRRIDRWLLVVPFFASKDVVLYAAKRSSEVRDWGLGCAGAVFTIGVLSQDDFEAEKRMLSGPHDKSSALRLAGVPRAEFDGPPVLIANLRRKLSGIEENAAQLEILVDEFTECFVRGQQKLELLRSRWPSDFEELGEVKGARQRRLSIDRMMSPGCSEPARLQALAVSLAEDYAGVAGLSGDVARELAFESIADWLMRCPLDFQ